MKFMACLTPSILPIRCAGGPRSNRGPLQKGRTLSSEAIQAVQSLKRASKTSSHPSNLNSVLSRLIKADLVATFNELLRQEHCDLALKVFEEFRSEYQIDLMACADLVKALTKKGMWQEIDHLILELEGEGVIKCDDKGLIKLVKALIASRRVESTVRIYGLMKRSGWRAEDEYLAKVLSRGLRSFGEERLAQEVDVEVANLFRGVLDNHRVQPNTVL